MTSGKESQNMRIAWLSNAPWAPTGYGNQTKVFTPRINAISGLLFKMIIDPP